MKKAKIVCYGCGREINALDRCPLCQTVGDIGFEENREWHWLCRLWASGKGYWGEREMVSLPLWFEKNPDQLPEWRGFKAGLLDMGAIPLPSHLKNNFGGTFEHWINNSGLLSLTIGTTGDLISQQSVGPLVHRLATTYADHHKAQWEAEEKAYKEAGERETLTKGKKKTRLLQRVGRRRKHERV